MFTGESYDGKLDRLAKREVSDYVAEHLEYFCCFIYGRIPDSSGPLKEALALSYFDGLRGPEKMDRLRLIIAEQAVAHIAEGRLHGT